MANKDYLKFLLSLEVGDKVVHSDGITGEALAYTRETIKKILKYESEVKLQFESCDRLETFNSLYPRVFPCTKEKLAKCDNYRYQKYLDNNYVLLKRVKTKEKMMDVYNFIEGLKK